MRRKFPPGPNQLALWTVTELVILGTVWVTFPPDRGGMDYKERHAGEATAVRPGVP